MHSNMSTTSFEIKTQRRSQMINITNHAQQFLEKSGITQGLLTVFVPHTTAGVTINENADPDVVHDVLESLERIAPWQQDFYQHNEKNSAAHVKSSLMGCSLSVPIKDGRMVLGTWQAIYFCEFDGPRSRRCYLNVTGERE